ncbi:uncharacterized protein LOC129585907 [Paramacrobiotus metropolitanus]|uniref:uncharacterized protein LOC129585907 n=1 Tax=Paramacrobiotus metropolitanus TaxID=2943436 RepID=UPI0024464CF5|nr:uncharacterized protein LOC129585907 [Paramacrobiotus metropolitanus]
MFNPRWWSGSKEKRPSSPGRASPGDLSRAEKIISAYRSSPSGKGESPTGDSQFSAERLRVLYNQVAGESSVTDTNSAEIVAALRSISEILIWGDKNDPSVFEVFLEKRMLAYFVCILQQCAEVFSDHQNGQGSRNNSPAPSIINTTSKVRGILTSRNTASDHDSRSVGMLSVKSAHHVCTQVMQVLHILFENISQDTSLYFLLSNNFINQIIECVYDFTDDEILAHYVSLMKILSAKLNADTIHFFYMEDLTAVDKNDFPLFDKALALFTHSESMVRIAARTVVLNVLRVKSRKAADKSFVENPAIPAKLMTLLCSLMKSQAEQMHSCLAQRLLDGFPDLLPHRDTTSENVDDLSLLRQKMISAWLDHQKRSDRYKDIYSDHESYLQYINDLMDLNVEPLKSCLTQSFREGYLLPYVVNPICNNVAQLAASDPELDSKELCASLLTSLLLLNVTIINVLDFELIFPAVQTDDLLLALLRCLRVFDNDEALPQDDRIPLLALSFCITLQQQLSAARSRVVPAKVEDFVKHHLLKAAMQLIHHIPRAGFVVCRAIVMRLACNLVDNIIKTDSMGSLDDHYVATLLDAKEQTCLYLQPFSKNDNQFIHLVELEFYAQQQQKSIQVDRFLEREFVAIFAFCPNPTRPSTVQTHSVVVGNTGTPRNSNEERGFPDLCKRWPLNADEEGRFYLRLHFLLRRLCKMQKSLSQSSLPNAESDPDVKNSSSNSSLGIHSEMPVPMGSLQVGDVVDISSCDTIIGCQMIPFHTHLASKPTSRSPTSAAPTYRPPQQLLCPSDEEKWVKRFLIIHQWQMLFVEPDSRRVGFAVVKETFVLPNVQMLTEKEQRERIVCCCALALNTNHRNHDVNALVGTDAKIMVKSIFLQVQQQIPQLVKAAPNDAPWNMEPHLEACVRIMFDDSIRALAASTRIKKNQERIRELKLGAITTLLDMAVDVGHQSSNNSDEKKDPPKTVISSHHRQAHAGQVRHSGKPGGTARRHPIMINTPASAASRSHSQEVTSSVPKTSSKSVSRERTAPRSGREGKPAPGISIPMTRLDTVTQSGFIERVEPQ